MGAWEEPQKEDRHLAGGRQTEPREVMTEGEARADKMETGGTWSRRPNRTQASAIWRPTVEPTEGGAMKEDGQTTPEGRQTAEGRWWRSLRQRHRANEPES